MSFMSFFVTLVLAFALMVLLWKVAAVFFAPYFVCKLPEKLGLVNLNLDSGNCTSFCVYFATEDSMYNFFTLFPWESRGILSFNGNEIRYEGSSYVPWSGIPRFLNRSRIFKRKYSRVQHYFNKQKAKITYIPPKFWRDGGLTWMRLEVDDRPYYFTTGRSRLGIMDIESSEVESTTGLYKLVSDI
jgi:hypothetical protein